ncbi:hypothetical protein KM043_014280 [Ampulex compressa]|nr:hypothetical protein KM043_014280 [Ampulex compressa]
MGRRSRSKVDTPSWNTLRISQDTSGATRSFSWPVTVILKLHLFHPQADAVADWRKGEKTRSFQVAEVLLGNLRLLADNRPGLTSVHDRMHFFRSVPGPKGQTRGTFCFYMETVSAGVGTKSCTLRMPRCFEK